MEEKPFSQIIKDEDLIEEITDIMFDNSEYLLYLDDHEHIAKLIIDKITELSKNEQKI